MLLGFTKILQVVLTVLPVLEKVAPIAEHMATLTPWKWDDKLVSLLKDVVTIGNKFSDNDETALISMGSTLLRKGQELKLTVEETLEALDDGLKLQSRAKEIRRGMRQQLVNGVPVVLGDRTLTTIADLKALPNSTFRLLAEAEYNAQKAGGSAE